eukprot:1108272-Pleurochrysis_carterae.AAC.1
MNGNALKTPSIRACRPIVQKETTVLQLVSALCAVQKGSKKARVAKEVHRARARLMVALRIVRVRKKEDVVLAPREALV